MGGISGRDVIDGGGGDDFINGENENDTLRGNSGDDLIKGGSGNDSLEGNNDDDGLDGDGGDDTLLGGRGRDTLFGDIGNDTLEGWDDNDWLDGFSGDDNLDGDGRNDTVVGGAGRDTINGGTGDDLLIGGAKGGIVAAPNDIATDDQQDHFLFEYTPSNFGFGSDTIEGFETGLDKVEFDFDILLNRESTSVPKEFGLTLKNFELFDDFFGNGMSGDGELTDIDGPLVSVDGNDLVLTLPESGATELDGVMFFGSIEYQVGGNTVDFDGGTIIFEGIMGGMEPGGPLENDFIFDTL